MLNTTECTAHEVTGCQAIECRAAVDPAQQPQGDPELDQAMQSVEGVRSYLTADVDDTERLRRADAVEQAENSRDGDNRKGVTDAVASARA
jgi:hypothetical protein